MKVALVTISDRGDLYMPHMTASLSQHVHADWDAIVRVDDSEHKLGMAGAVRKAWTSVPDDIDFVVHVEEDFVFRCPVDIPAMAECLTFNPHLAQLVLKRQPWSPPEHAAGGIMEMHPRDYVEKDEYVEHKRIFSLNPCLIPKSVIDIGWPDGNEAEFTQMCLDEGLSFGFWGKRDDPPVVEHIGAVRGSGWRL